MKKTILLFILVASLASCKKGDTGEPGTNGNANVQSWSVSNQVFTYSSLFQTYYLKLSVPIITTEVVNTGSVTVYGAQASVQIQEPSGWFAIPSAGRSLDVTYGVQEVYIWSTVPQDTISVKVVVIPSN